MPEVAVLGAGMIPFGEHPEMSLVQMSARASCLALEDAGLEPGRVEMGIFANALGGRLSGDMTVGQHVFWELGISRVPVVNVENACTSGSTALYLGYNLVAAGQAEVVLVAGGEKMCLPEMGLINSGEGELDTKLGMVAPAGFAMRAVRHMHQYGTTRRQLAWVAVKNRAHARHNPVCRYRQPLSLEEVLAAPMIVDPLTLFQCCPNADGAAAVVLGAYPAAASAGKTVRLDAAVLCSGSYQNPQDFTHWETDYRGARQIYEKAGLGPEDLDLVECHDAFTIAEILHYEALGLCEPGGGGRLVESGQTALGGRIPVNPSGGLLSRGHPVAATGLAQVVELALQLRGRAGKRQVPGARVGLAHCMGGDKAADTKSYTLAVFSV